MPTHTDLVSSPFLAGLATRTSPTTTSRARSSGITDRDFALARKIEEVVLWRPEPGGLLEGSPNQFVRGSK